MKPDREAAFARFLDDYTRIRRRESRCSADPEYFRALPEVGPHDSHRREWMIRAASFRCLVDRVVTPLAASRGRPLLVADLGAGNGWLSHRLAEAGHRVAAVDINCDDGDGLGACRHYPEPIERVQAEFDHLPFAEDGLDLVVFNGSLHYSTDIVATLGHAVVRLRSGGRLAVVDSPIYRDSAAGDAMRRDLHKGFAARHGTCADSIPIRSYLSHDDLTVSADRLALEWRWERPAYGLRWALRPLIARLRRRREPATFAVLWAARG